MRDNTTLAAELIIIMSPITVGILSDALENSRIMIHQPLISGGLRGQAIDISIHANELLKIKDKLAEILAKNTGKIKSEILKDTERDNYFSSYEAKEYGLIDGVFTR